VELDSNETRIRRRESVRVPERASDARFLELRLASEQARYQCSKPSLSAHAEDGEVLSFKGRAVATRGSYRDERH
jgi:hypothetical protein